MVKKIVKNVNTLSQIFFVFREKEFLLNARSLKITEKSLIQHCERSELRLHFEWTELIKKC